MPVELLRTRLDRAGRAMSVQVIPEGTARLRVLEAWQARLAVIAAAILSRRSPEKIHSALTRWSARRPQATTMQCARARSAVCTVSRACRGQKGCLRRSIATTLLCQIQGTSASWCTGFSLAPFRAHAWVEVDGRPVGEQAEVSDYMVVLTTGTTGSEGDSRA